MEAQQTKINIFLEIPNVSLYKIDGDEEQLLQTNTLMIGQIPNDPNSNIMIMGNFHYSLTSNTAAMSSQGPNNSILYAFPGQQGFYGVVISPQLSGDEKHAQFVNILQQATKFANIDQNQVQYDNVEYQELDEQQQQQKEQVKQEEEKEVKEEKEEKEEKIDSNNKTDVVPRKKSVTDKFTNFLYAGGTLFKKGMLTGATKVAQGINKGGKYIKSKLKKNKKETKIKDSTKSKFKIARKVTHSIFVGTQSIIKAVIKGAEHLGKDVVKKFEKSKKGSKISKSGAYKGAQKVGKAGIHVVASVYDGLYGALTILGRGVTDTTTELVEHKYGSDLAQVTNDTLNTVGNVGKLSKVYKITGSEQIAKDTKQEKDKLNMIEEDPDA